MTQRAAVAEAPSKPAETAWPLLPPPELNFPNPKPRDSLTELQTALATKSIKLLQPDEDAEVRHEPAESPASAFATAASPPAPEAPPATLQAEAPRSATDSDSDDFLFEPTPPQATAAQPGPAPEWASGTYPDPALVTPRGAQASEDQPASPKPAARAHYDPLAPLRALSDEEKIALFS